MAETISCETVEAAREYAKQHDGKYLVLSPEILAQIEQAEAQGGFEGGMSGASGQGGFSAPGLAPDHSEAGESGGDAGIDLDGAVRVGAFFEWAAETMLSLRDVWEAFH